MSDTDMSQFVKDRDDALRSLDLAKVRAYMEKYGSPMPSDDVLEISMHKARTASLGMTNDEREHSIKWLRDRGYSHFADRP